MKCCDDRFASNPQYIVHALDWIERNVVAISVHFTERKQFQSEISVGQLVNHNNVRRMISDVRFSRNLKTVLSTHNMLLDALAKIRQFGVYTFFLNCSAGEFHWTEIIQVVDRQYGEMLTDEQVNAVDLSTKVNYLKRNPVTTARQVDYAFKQLWGKVILSGMHPIGQILNFDEHIHAPIHIVDAPQIEDSEVVEFIDKHITCALFDAAKHPEMSNLVKKMQTHHQATTCRKKKGVACRFNAPWAPSNKTGIICCEEKIDETILNQSKDLIEKVLPYIVTISDLSAVTLSQILEEF